ncbi:MAG TPA: MBL fold metallo-hydrolase [Candidatus Limnocylindrales bacterium]
MVALGLVAIHRPDGATRLTVLDVGQGDAILLEGGRGSRMLIDGGPDPGRLLVALDERLPPWDRRLDAIVLTHPHEDHVAGLALLLARYRVGRVFEPGMIGPGPGYAAWNTELSAAANPSRWALGAGDRLSVDDVDLRVLWPDPGKVPLRPADGGTAINNVSIVVLGEVAGHRFLLAGDIEQGIDPVLLQRGLPTVDVLKVAHHGSGTASTQEFLDAVRPGVAIVSVGAGNPYGHPVATTMNRLRSVARRIYRTDLGGSVTVTFDGPSVRLHESGGRARAAGPGGTAAGAGSGPGRITLPPLRHPPVPPGPGSAPLYHRLDDGTLPGGGGSPVALPRSTGLAVAAFARRRRGRGLARPTDRAREPLAPDRSRPHRGGRVPPRRGQDPPACRAPRPPPRRGWSDLAQRAGSPGARGGRLAASRDGPRHRGWRRRPCRLLARGPRRRLRRQARSPAAGLDGGAIRALVGAPPEGLEPDGRDPDLAARPRPGGRDLRARRLPAGRGPAAGLGRPGARPRSDARRMSAPVAAARAPLAYYWGDDGYGLEAATEAFRHDVTRFPDGAPERAPVQIDAGNPRAGLAELSERVATGVMFGSGVVVLVSGIANAVRRAADRDALLAALAVVAPGNGLVILEETDSGTKEPPGRAVVEAIRAAGGEIRRYEAPREGGLAAWLEARARERGLTLGPGAARELATRVGGFIRERDVDRRNQGRLAVMELEKLGLRHADGGPVTADDVRELVAEAVPGTIWGFVDAVGMRQRTRSLELLERLLDATPEPVLLTVLHRRIRELLEVADRLASGETPGSLVRSMRLQPFRAEILVRQAAGWSLPELEAALEGLLELDAMVKGVGGRAADAARQRLAFDLWITDRVAPA